MNAFIAVQAERALRQAQQVDEKIRPKSKPADWQAWGSDQGQSCGFGESTTVDQRCSRTLCRLIKPGH
jgi:hypothetical protein